MRSFGLSGYYKSVPGNEVHPGGNTSPKSRASWQGWSLVGRLVRYGVHSSQVQCYSNGTEDRSEQMEVVKHNARIQHQHGEGKWDAIEYGDAEQHPLPRSCLALFS